MRDRTQQPTTALESDIARLVAAEYDFGGPDRRRLLHSGVNDTYAVDIEGRRYALRLHGKSTSLQVLIPIPSGGRVVERSISTPSLCPASPSE